MTLSDLLKEFDASDSAWETAKKNADDCYNQRSSIIKQIFEANNSKPKLKRRLANGTIVDLTIVKRGDTYFFRGLDKKAEDIQIVD